jgi:hypothetical protein
MRRRSLAGRRTVAAANAALTAGGQLCAYALISPARRGVAHPGRVLVAEDGMREENGGDGTALIRPPSSTNRKVVAVRRARILTTRIFTQAERGNGVPPVAAQNRFALFLLGFQRANVGC